MVCADKIVLILRIKQMRSITGVAALLLLSLSVSQSASAKDWGDINVAERLLWAESHIRQTCPHMVVTTADRSKAGVIGSVPQMAVKAFIASQCPSKSARVR